MNKYLIDMQNYESREAAHTILMRWPGVVVSAQVHAFLLGYLSGQLGLVIVPLTLLTVWSQPAAMYHYIYLYFIININMVSVL